MFIYLSRNISSTESDFKIHQVKAWNFISKLPIIWKSDLSSKIKRDFFPSVSVFVLPYGCTPWTLTKRMEKKLLKNYARMLCAVLNKSWKQYPRKQQVYNHLASILLAIQIRRSRHRGIACEARMNSYVTFPYGLQCMDTPVLADLHTSALWWHWM